MPNGDISIVLMLFQYLIHGNIHGMQRGTWRSIALLYIAEALNNIGGKGISLWDEEDEFFYDVLHLPDDSRIPLKVRSLVAFIPLLAVETVEPDLLDALPDFKARLEWFLEHRPHLAKLVSHWHVPGMEERRLLALVRGHRMKRLLKRMLDPKEFLSDYGIRAISKYHEQYPYDYRTSGMDYIVKYEPNDPYWRDKLLFYEYFHGDTERGVGASHQTGWTALVAKLLEQTGGR